MQARADASCRVKLFSVQAFDEVSVQYLSQSSLHASSLQIACHTAIQHADASMQILADQPVYRQTCRHLAH